MRTAAMKDSLCLAACTLMFIADMVCAAPVSPYAGQETRDIKSLSAEDIDSYLTGKGMGLAKAAELNGYPGPAHVLALASELKLTDEQKRRSQALFERMESRASKLGRELVDRERELDQAFASHAITKASLDTRLKAIGALQAQVRAVHLAAHLEQIAILTPQQVGQYLELRGYRTAAQPESHDDNHGENHNAENHSHEHHH